MALRVRRVRARAGRLIRRIPSIATFLHTMVRITDAERSRSFYEAFGFRFSSEMGTAYGHIAIGVDDLDGTLARLAERGIEPERPPYTVREGDPRLCFIRDPDRELTSVN